MTRRVVSVEMDDRLLVVKELFDRTRFHHLLVVEAGKLVGVVSDRDLYRALSPWVGLPVATQRDDATLNKRVHQIMSRKPVTVHAEAELEEAADALLKGGISCLPVVDTADRPVGIVTWRDLLAALRDNACIAQA